MQVNSKALDILKLNMTMFLVKKRIGVGPYRLTDIGLKPKKSLFVSGVK